MDTYLEQLPEFIEKIKSIKETILTNIVLIGQVAAPTFKEKNRTEVFMERILASGADECTTDDYRNPIGIVRGISDTPPIFVVAHLDTFSNDEEDLHFMVTKDRIQGPSILDNSVGVGVLASLPNIFQKLNLRFNSDIILASDIQSLGKGNLRGMRHLIKSWSTPIRGAVCIEGIQLGRLNYYSDGMIRGEIDCNITVGDEWEPKFKPNAILVLNEVINQILRLKLPQRPRSRVIFGKISGGFKHGFIAFDAKLGFEIQGDTYKMVRSIYNDIQDIVAGISHEYEVNLKLKTISNAKASRLKFNHPLVKAASAIIKKLDMKPAGAPSESELSIFLSRKISAVTLGITKGEDYHLENSSMEIEPMFKGIAQIVGTIMAIDSGVCDE